VKRQCAGSGEPVIKVTGEDAWLCANCRREWPQLGHGPAPGHYVHPVIARGNWQLQAIRPGGGVMVFGIPAASRRQANILARQMTGPAAIDATLIPFPGARQVKP
jgi:hypothetical protein